MWVELLWGWRGSGGGGRNWWKRDICGIEEMRRGKDYEMSIKALIK